MIASGSHAVLPRSASLEMPPDAACCAIVIVPARNEEAGLPAALDALRMQVDSTGEALAHATYEVLLLLNNCTDGSVAVAGEYAAAHPEFALRIMERSFAPEQAHVGTARRMLMDLACERLESLALTDGVQAILSTDADTLVAPDWIAQNVAELERGAEVVGGVIHLFAEEMEGMDAGIRQAYERDRQLQALVAELESLLDPDPADPWPRHVEHFGASLACTPAVYRRAGGLPAVKPLEDVAFINNLRRVGARIRHSPEVHIRTSARMDGRAEVGLSGQLRHWQQDCLEGRAHLVESTAWLEHRFGSLARLRQVHGGCTPELLASFPEGWRGRLEQAAGDKLAMPRFLEVIDCDRLIEDTFTGARHVEILEALDGLRAAIELQRGRGKL